MPDGPVKHLKKRRQKTHIIFSPKENITGIIGSSVMMQRGVIFKKLKKKNVSRRSNTVVELCSEPASSCKIVNPSRFLKTALH